MVRRFRKRNQEHEEPAISYTRLECPSGFLYPLVWMWMDFWLDDVVAVDCGSLYGPRWRLAHRVYQKREAKTLTCSWWNLVLGPSSIRRHVGLRVTGQLSVSFFQSRICAEKFNSNSILVTTPMFLGLGW